MKFYIPFRYAGEYGVIRHCVRVGGGANVIYFDNAATTLKKPPQVIEAVTAALSGAGNAARGAHPVSLEASRTVYEARCKTAALFGCGRPDHVIFTSNATEALNIALNGLFASGDHIITTELEHNSVLRPLYRLEAEQGVALSFLPADRMGRIDYDDLERLLRPETRAVVCTHASNLTGYTLDLERIGRFTRKNGLLLVADVTQTAGSLPIDMRTMGVDVLCFTGHKGLMGPQGTGGLCLREGVSIRPWKVGGSGVQSYLSEQPKEYPTRLEAGTMNTPGLAGLSAALDFLRETGTERIQAHEHALLQRFCDGVRDVDGVTLYGDYSQKERAAIAALNLRDCGSGEISDILAEEYGIATRPGAHCAPRMHRALGTEAQGAVRFSFSYFNTAGEVDAAIAAVRRLAEET